MAAHVTPRERKKKSGIWKRFFSRLLCFILVTILLLVGLLYAGMYIVCKGPSETARNLFVRSVRETSAIGFLANLYLSDAEIAEIEHASENVIIDESDASLITVSADAGKTENDLPYTDAWGYVDDDNDGLILVKVPGPTYTGYMMIVLDPSRVICAANTDPSSLGIHGYTVEEYVKQHHAVVGINGGGFEDDNGMGNGGVPNSVIASQGTVYYEHKKIGKGFVGIDENDILQVGFTDVEDVKARHIRDGAGFGPVLMVNGEIVDESLLTSGLNPRTAIGQRSDGAILMLVIDGRQPNSLGATYADEAEIMQRFGAVNACNLDGGSSSLMWYQGEYINNCASVIGIRPIPTSFVVLEKEASNEK